MKRITVNEDVTYLLSEERKELHPLFILWGLGEGLVPQISSRIAADFILLSEEVKEIDPLVLDPFRAEEGEYSSDKCAWHLLTSSVSVRFALVFALRFRRELASFTLFSNQVCYDTLYALIPDLPIAIVTDGDQEKWRSFLLKQGHERFCIFHSADSSLESILPLRVDDEVSITKIGTHIHHFASGLIDSFYLVEYEEEALLIDTGSPITGFIEHVRSVTDKPLHLLLTHGHSDHIGNISDFEEIWYPEADRELLPSSYSGIVHYLKGGEELSFGGHIVQVIALAGHTAGSLLYCLEEEDVIFTGDALGSGINVLLNFPYSTSVCEYRNSIARFIESHGKRDLLFLGGHLSQESSDGGLDGVYHPLSWESIRDMHDLCDRIGSVPIRRFPPADRFGFGETFIASYGSAAMVITKDKLR